MKHAIVSLAFFLTASAMASPSVLIRPPVGHPLLGKWEWTRVVNQCTEAYEFRDDGTVPVLSGTEKTDNVYNVSANPDVNGFYRIIMRTTKDYGGKDCADDESDSTGTESTNYILFSPNRDQYVACREAKLEKCFGPLRRIQR